MTTLKRNTVWSLTGSGVPLIAAIFAIPYLLRIFGSEAFGVLTLIWALIGYFSLFDFGVGRALTYEVGKRMPATQFELAPYIKAGVTLTLATGILGSIVVIIFANRLSHHWLNIKPIWQDDAHLAFLIAGIGVIPTTLSSGLRGALEGLNRFSTSNINRLVVGVLMFLLPALSVYIHGPHLWIATIYMVTGRLIVSLATIIQLKQYLFHSININKHHLASLINYGVWISVTGIIGPLMVYGDRFFVSAVVGPELLTLYAIPQEGLQRLLILPAALCGALLPRLSSQNNNQKLSTYKITFKRIALSMLGVCVIAVVLAYPLMSLWISPQFASKAMPIVVILSLGIWFNAISLVPYTVLHSLGRPKITAIFHMIELLIYFGLIWHLTNQYGLIGAAVSWVIRVMLDFAMLSVTVKKIFNKLT